MGSTGTRGGGKKKMTQKEFYTKQREDAMKGKNDVGQLKGVDSPTGQAIEGKLLPKGRMHANDAKYASSEMRKKSSKPSGAKKGNPGGHRGS